MRKIAARVVHGVAAQAGCAAFAAAIAAAISSLPAAWALPSRRSFLWGARMSTWREVRTSLPPMNSGASTGFAVCRASSAFKIARSGLPGA